MRMRNLIFTGILAGIYSAILDGFEENYGLHYIVSAVILTVLTIITALSLLKIGKNENKTTQ
ncbi:hypothetical protein QUF56_11665 [Ureibacillus composti]|nr:hypothetical protein [Ureibacillus composti]